MMLAMLCQHVLFRLTPSNRNSIAALIGYIKNRIPSTLKIAVAVSAEAAYEQFPTGPHFVVYSFTTWESRNVFREIKQLRNCWSRTLFLGGGPHPSGDPEKTKQAGFDYIFVGEGEVSLYTFLNASGKVAKGIILPEKTVSLDEVDTFLPEFGLIPPLEITRGCRYHCAYCQTPCLFSGEIRHRSLASAIQWFRQVSTAGIKQIRFITPNALGYGASKGNVVELNAIAALLGAAKEHTQAQIFYGTFPSEVRPEDCSAEALELLRQHCQNRRIVIGAQSGSDRMLSIMRRGHTVDHICHAVQVVRGYGFIPVVDFIFGLPYEREEDRCATRDLLAFLTDKYAAIIRGHTFMPLPGTLWHEENPGKIDTKTYLLMTALQKRGMAEGYWQLQAEYNYMQG